MLKLSVALGSATLVSIASIPSLASTSADMSPCGIGVVAGVAGCIDWEMKKSEYEALVAKALKGDNAAAEKLADFNDVREDVANSSGRRWRLLAAERGSCNAIFRMLDDAAERRDRAGTAKWKTRARWNQCKRSVPRY